MRPRTPWLLPSAFVWCLVLLSTSAALGQGRLEAEAGTLLTSARAADDHHDRLAAAVEDVEMAAAAAGESAEPVPIGLDLVSSAPGTEEDRPWSLQRELDRAGGPEWLEVSGSVRLRYEGIDGQFRAAGRLDDQDHVFVLRTLLKIAADFETVAFTVEGQDSRQYGGNFGSALGTSSVNAAELLQAHVELRFSGHMLRAGRQTIDLGSRRLVARNRFRNTLNAFTGLRWDWKEDEFALTVFYTLPVRRTPSDLPSIIDNEVEFDDEGLGQQFFGVYYERVFERHVFSAKAFGLLEDLRGSNDRDIFTISVRFILPKKKGELDYEIEGAFQFGKSRRTGSGPRLDHRAGFVHVSVGYTFDAAWRPRVRLAFDWASGDDDPGDGENNRFDTLFGARRFEFGPTGIYGAIARSNILSPEARLELKPRSDMSLMFAARTLFLASREDAWTTARVADPSGSSGRFVGQQLEARWRWDLFRGVLRLEAGLAVLFHGEFQDDAPGGQGTDTVYGYFQTVFKF